MNCLPLLSCSAVSHAKNSFRPHRVLAALAALLLALPSAAQTAHLSGVEYISTIPTSPFLSPEALAVDSVGNVLVTDTGDGTVREGIPGPNGYTEKILDNWDNATTHTNLTPFAIAVGPYNEFYVGLWFGGANNGSQIIEYVPGTGAVIQRSRFR